MTAAKRNTGPRAPRGVPVRDGDALKRLRVRRRWSQVALALRAGVTVSVVQRAEQGNNIEYQYALAIAKVFGKTINDMFVVEEPDDYLIDASAVEPVRDHRIEFTGSQNSMSDKQSKSVVEAKGFTLSVDGFIFNQVVELLNRDAVPREDIQRSYQSYRRGLEDFAFAVVYGTKILSPINPLSVRNASTELGWQALAHLPPGLYDTDILDDTCAPERVFNNGKDLKEIARYFEAIGNRMQQKLFAGLMQEFMEREGRVYLGESESVFSRTRDPKELEFKKVYYRFPIIEKIPSLIGNRTFDRIVDWLPRTAPSQSPEEPGRRYSKFARQQLALGSLLTHVGKMYQNEKSAGIKYRWRVPYILRAEIMQQRYDNAKLRKHIEGYFVRHALLTVLPHITESAPWSILMVVLGKLRNSRDFTNLRQILGELSEATWEEADAKEQAAGKLLQEIHDAPNANHIEGHSFRFYRNTLLTKVEQASNQKYEKELYRVFPELAPPSRSFPASVAR